MPDPFAPVANTGNPGQAPNIFQNMQSIMGLAQQKQALDVTANQLRTQNEAKGFLADFDPSQYIGSDGTLNVNTVRASDGYKKLSLGKPVIDEYLQKVQNGQLAAKQSLQTLDNDTLGMMARGVGSLAIDPEVVKDTPEGRAKVENYYKSFSNLSPQAARIAGTFGSVVTHAPPGKLSDAVGAQQLMGADVLGQRSQQNPQATTNAAGQIINRNPQTGALSAPQLSGAATNPSSIAVAGATTSATTRAGGVAKTDVDVNDEITKSVKPAQDAINATQRIDPLIDVIKTGKWSKAATDLYGAAGSNDPVVTARQLIKKNAEQLKSVALQGATSDSARAQIAAGFPDTDSMTADALRSSNETIRGTMRQQILRDQNRQAFIAKHGTIGLANSDNQVNALSDPLILEYQAQKTGPERQAFLARHFPDKAKAAEFAGKINALKHHVPESTNGQ